MTLPRPGLVAGGGPFTREAWNAFSAPGDQIARALLLEVGGYVLTLGLDIGDFMRRTQAIAGRHLPQAEVWALNWTAEDVLADLQQRMRVRFDRPTRFALNAFHVWRATKAARIARVEERPSVGKRHFLKVQELGGQRPQTGLDRLLMMRVAQDAPLAAVVPMGGARLDQYGNWSPGERNQALSEIGAQNDAAANSTAASIARARARGRARYFTPAHGGLSPGIWKRTGEGVVSKVATFTPTAPSYRPRLGFMEGAGKVYRERLPVNFRRALGRALETAR